MFTIIILNSFSGSLPISSSFIWTSVFLVCALICVVFLCLFIIVVNLLCLSHSPLHLPRVPSNIVLISGASMGAAQILTWSYSCVFLPPISTAIRTSVFSFVGTLDVLLYILQTHSLPSFSCGLICGLYSRWEGFGSSSLATLPLGFRCGFISTSARGSSTGVCS